MATASDELFIGTSSGYASQFPTLRIYGGSGFYLGVASSRNIYGSATTTDIGAAGTTSLSATASKVIFAKGFRRGVTSVTDTYTILVTDDVIAVGTLASAKTLTLPASPTAGDTHVIKDIVGECATRNITIAPAAGNIDGAANFVMNINYQAVTVVYTGSQWSIV
jgi:hypothetical protein